MNSLVFIQNQEPLTTSLVIAEGTDNEHASVIKLVRMYQTDLEEFGRVGFQIEPFDTAGGMQSREIALLNEQQATFLITLMRNSEIVVQFKKALVKAFFEMRTMLRDTPDRRVDVNMKHTRGITNENGLDIRYTLDLTKIALNPTPAGLAILERITGIGMEDILPARAEHAAGSMGAAMQDFFDSHIALVSHNVIPFAVIYSAFRRWCHDSGRRLSVMPTKNAFGRFMADRGVRKNNTGTRCFTNIELVGV